MINMHTLNVSCPICSARLPLRHDKHGGRYFRCGLCRLAFFCSDAAAIECLDSGGTFRFVIEPQGESAGERLSPPAELQ
jgi:hypothetical protein